MDIWGGVVPLSLMYSELSRRCTSFGEYPLKTELLIPRDCLGTWMLSLLTVLK